MPCDAVREVTLDLEVADQDVLVDGLTAIGASVSTYGDRIVVAHNGTYATIQGGKITVNEGREAIANEIKRAYAAEAIRSATKRYGWAVKVDAKNPNHLRIIPR